MRVTVIVNGNGTDLDLDAAATLAGALRDDCGVASAHLGCSDGTCGACTVLVDGEAIRSCLMLAVQCDGARVQTVEGLAPDHPSRAGSAADPRLSCPACAPGRVMLAAGALRHDPGLAHDPDRLRRLLSATNVCRCSTP